ncbi:MAG: NIPSNAP family protein [Pseudomonadota bacterium]
MALYELRQYKVRNGQMAPWLELMEGEIIPYVVSKGMRLVASFCAEDDPSIYIWIRRFEDEADRERLYAEVYESAHWKSELSPKIGRLLIREKAIIHRLIPTSLSPMK